MHPADSHKKEQNQQGKSVDEVHCSPFLFYHDQILMEGNKIKTKYFDQQLGYMEATVNFDPS